MRLRRTGHFCRAFTLIELAVVFVVLGLIAVLIMKLLPALTDRMRLDETESELQQQVDEAVVGFALANNRLPCPDTSKDGFEGGSGGCEPSDEVGRLPFRDMGLPEPALDEARRPIRYGVYRNAGAKADLAVLEENLFEPALPDTIKIDPLGTVTGCNETLDQPETTIVYQKPPNTTVTVNPIDGTFQEDEFVGFLKLDFDEDDIVAEDVPEPLDAPLDTNEDDFCPCGAASSFSCLQCPATFIDGKFTVTLEEEDGFIGHVLTTDLIDENPITIVRDVLTFGSTQTVYGFPGVASPADPLDVIPDDLEGFQPGDTVYEMFNPLGDPPLQPTRDDAPETDNPGGSPDPIVSENLLSGVSGELTDSESKTAHVVSVESIGGGLVELGLDQLPEEDFEVGDRIYGATSGAVGEVVSPGQVTVISTFEDDPGETVDSSSGGSAVIKDGSVNDPPDTITGSFVVEGEITGTINAPGLDQATLDGLIDGSIDPETFSEADANAASSEGDTIEGRSSGTVATVIAIRSDDSSTPVVAHGAISFDRTESGQINELDFCQSLRYAIAAAGVTGSTSFVHTVNEDAIPMNPAYLLASGGVEDADGDGVDIAFDQRNEIATLRDFESPARLRNDSSDPAAVYDDLVAVMQMQTLADRLLCARNIGAVNALAAAATVQRNLLEMSFERNEQALSLIELSYRSVILARHGVAIQTFQLAIQIAQVAVDIYKQIKDPEGIPIFVATLVIDFANIANAIGALVIAVETLESAEGTYAGACVSQDDTEAAVLEAITEAENALKQAKQADAWGGVR